MNTSSKSAHSVRTRLHSEFIGPVHPREALHHVLKQQTLQNKYPAPSSINLLIHPAIVAFLLFIVLVIAFASGE